MLIMNFGDVQETFFDFFLVIQIYLTLTLQILHLSLDFPIFGTYPTLRILLFVKVLTPFLLDT